MTLDKKRAILEAAAKACGYEGTKDEHGIVARGGDRYWNPLTNSADTASMCARLNIDTYWNSDIDCVCCGAAKTETISDLINFTHSEPYDGTPEGKEAAWRFAATMVAAKVGGFAE